MEFDHQRQHKAFEGHKIVFEFHLKVANDNVFVFVLTLQKTRIPFAEIIAKLSSARIILASYKTNEKFLN